MLGESNYGELLDDQSSEAGNASNHERASIPKSGVSYWDKHESKSDRDGNLSLVHRAQKRQVTSSLESKIDYEMTVNFLAGLKQCAEVAPFDDSYADVIIQVLLQQ